jgi:hypothetical protein
MLTTGQWLRLVVVVALELLLFRGIFFILIVPPVAITTVTLNLILACTWVRPQSMNRAILAATVAGFVVILGSLAYLAVGMFRAPVAVAIAHALPDPLHDALPDALRTAWGMQLLDFLILDTLGIAAMVLAGWLAWPRSRARRVSAAS